jgi:DNA polymerase-4
MRPALRNRPVILTDDDTETAPVSACNGRAARYDVTVGMTAARANSLCPGLIVGQRDIEREKDLLRRMIGSLEQVGPDIEPGDGSVFLETSRLRRMYGDEQGIARRIFAVLRPYGYPLKIGFGTNKFVARAAAGQAESNRCLIIPTGVEGSWLHHLHVDRLALSEETEETLADLGIVTIGQAAALPPNEVLARFGRDGLALTRRARGDDPELFLPKRPDDDYRGVITLDYPSRNTESLTRTIERILGGLLEHLRRHGRAAVEVQVTFQLDDHTESVFKASVERPAASPDRFLRQIRSRLERFRLDASVTDIGVRIPQASTLHLEQTTFDRRSSAAAIDRRTCETIHRNLNGNRLCTVELCPAGLPERTFRLSPVMPSPGRSQTNTGADEPNIPVYSLRHIAGLRLLQPPRPAEVRLDRDVGGQGTVYDGSRAYRITCRRGPWKLSGDWWLTGFDRLYYELSTADARRYLVFFDRGKSRWFLQGVYD